MTKTSVIILAPYKSGKTTSATRLHKLSLNKGFGVHELEEAASHVQKARLTLFVRAALNNPRLWADYYSVWHPILTDWALAITETDVPTLYYCSSMADVRLLMTLVKHNVAVFAVVPTPAEHSARVAHSTCDTHELEAASFNWNAVKHEAQLLGVTTFHDFSHDFEAAVLKLLSAHLNGAHPSSSHPR